MTKQEFNKIERKECAFAVLAEAIDAGAQVLGVRKVEEPVIIAACFHGGVEDDVMKNTIHYENGRKESVK